MTSLLTSPQSFHARPIAPPVVARVPGYRCSACGRVYLQWINHCTCHPSTLLHAHELNADELARVKRGA